MTQVFSSEKNDVFGLLSSALRGEFVRPLNRKVDVISKDCLVGFYQEDGEDYFALLGPPETDRVFGCSVSVRKQYTIKAEDVFETRRGSEELFPNENAYKAFRNIQSELYSMQQQKQSLGVIFSARHLGERAGWFALLHLANHFQKEV